MHSSGLLGRSRQALGQARTLVADLEGGIERYFAAQPFEVQISNEPDTGEDVYRIRLPSRLPGSFARLTRAAARLQVLALDELVRAFVVEFGRPRRVVKHRFPFAASAADLDKTIQRKFALLPACFTDFLRDARPYPGGNDALCALLRLQKTSRRRLLKPAVNARAILVHQGQSVSGPAFLSAPIWNERRSEVLMRGKDPQSQLSGQARIDFYVTLRTMEIPKCPTVQSVLTRQLVIVSDLIDQAEAMSGQSHLTLQSDSRSHRTTLRQQH